MKHSCRRNRQDTVQNEPQIMFDEEFKKIRDTRLKHIRYWVIFNYLIFIIVAPSFHYFRWRTMSMKGHLSIICQTAIQFLVTLGLITSYFKNVKIIYYLTLLQSCQFLLFNFLHFTAAESKNHTLLN